MSDGASTLRVHRLGARPAVHTTADLPVPSATNGRAIAAAHARNGDVREALDLITEIPDHDWRARSLRDLGAVLVERGDIHAAEQVAWQLRDLPEDVRVRERDDALGWAAGLFARTGDRDSALVAAAVADAERRSSILVDVAVGQAEAGSAGADRRLDRAPVAGDRLLPDTDPRRERRSGHRPIGDGTLRRVRWRPRNRKITRAPGLFDQGSAALVS